MNRTVAIIGAGFAGSLTAVNLLRQDPTRGLQVVLIERRPPFGRGLAYGTWDDNLLLNVPAGNMSAFADDPGHFLAYCRSIDPAFNSGSFIPRRIYGDYIEDILRQAESESGGRLQRRAREALGLRAEGERYAVEFADGPPVLADQIVLAFGHFLPKQPLAVPDFFPSHTYIANPWDFAALDRANRGGAVALIGAGHTAIDTAFRLTNRGDARKVYLLSRRGLLPHGHRMTPRPPVVGAFPSYLENGVCGSIRALTRAVRAEARQRLAAGDDWRDVVNELRPHTQEIWHRLPEGERGKFLQRIVPFWDIHRHRLAPAARLRLERMLESGLLENIAGRLLGVEPQDDGVALAVRERASGLTRKLTVGTIVNCSGPNYDVASMSSPLLVQMRDQGWIRSDALRLGLETDESYRIVDRGGAGMPNVFYIGPMLKARHWEAIAVPELRGHSQRLARALLAAAPPAARPGGAA
jgi:uncharacterized NAD(P)/FAD-binding protein YdhS